MAAERWLSHHNLATRVQREQVEPAVAERPVNVDVTTEATYDPQGLWQKGSFALRKLYHDSAKPLLVIYTSPSCGPCHVLKPQLQRLIQELDGSAQAVVIDIEADQEIAEQAGFPNHKKKDSTGICFIGERKFRDFLQRYLPAQPGEIVTPEEEIIGQHQGLMYYTLGQRQGLGIGGRQDANEAPWYVVGKDLQHNRLIAAQGHDHPLLLCQELEAGQIHWIAGTTPRLPLTCEARIRHRQSLQACQIEPQTNGHCRVIFENPQRAVTPGQAIVFYQDRECRGGGTIESANRNQTA